LLAGLSDVAQLLKRGGGAFNEDPSREPFKEASASMI